MTKSSVLWNHQVRVPASSLISDRRIGPEERAIVYSDRVSSGNYLVMISGSQETIRRAYSILQSWDIHEWKV